MSTTTNTKAAGAETSAEARTLGRIAREGYGPGAWHGPDLKAALEDVPVALAFWRPAPGAHNIAEIAMHHAFCARSVRGRLSGRAPEPFPLPGEDWFAVADEKAMPWARVQEILRLEQERLTDAVAGIGRGSSELGEAERFDLVLGITGHAIYHAGQVQLVKRLHAAR